ncbi:histone acetylation protein-domain-containing protein [Microdochium trichocladiopsis]|uniref:histone acetyltransferase n=1 Tax=Microdochium trichocladiopsis TaxID=1682393 RepID=A0A9P9BSB7_9PEZI|nr:histone acetylation protein-domain-containing protein [Microdochium trichocladiopsis]KAH7033583.1 histone acetylation protein-domain-containing protein [Microdochium trichocladiopsis]
MAQRNHQTSTRQERSSGFVHDLESVLPKGYQFQTHHLSTPPTVCDALCQPPTLPSAAGSGKRRPTKPPKTYCEKHFLAISVDSKSGDARDQVLVLGLEIYLYTTAFSTIIFVAKADSTGYLSTLDLPKGTPSPIREVTTTFVKYLVRTRHRKGTQLVVNLFARSQDQYLFPGSVKNTKKHVLDDRGLIKWWCRVVNGLLEDDSVQKDLSGGCSRVHGHLLIPGLDTYETRAFIPRTATAPTNWTLAHPLEHISPYAANPSVYGSSIPPRCLIPTFPDDPKARFVEELEEATPQNLKTAGRWRGPQNLDEFWEMMAFRQECSSGRMTGFIWVVFDPVSRLSLTSKILAGDDGQDSNKKGKGRKKSKLRGHIRPRAPKVKTTRAKFPKKTETSHYTWPESGRGQVILDEDGYKRAVELLLHLEFKELTVATTSTMRWLKEVNVGKDWSLQITGRRDPAVGQAPSEAGSQTVNNLSGMIRKKRTADAPAEDSSAKILDAGLVRKKPKTETAPEAVASGGPIGTGNVNVLSTGLVRKKPKTS